MQPYPQSPQFAGPPPAQKKSAVLPWVLGGCGALLVLAVIVGSVAAYFLYRTGKEFTNNPTRAAAKIIEFADKNIEIVSVDEEKKRITFKDKRTGKVETVTLDELQQRANNDAKSSGESGGSNGEGSKTPELPEWLSIYPGAQVTQTSSADIAGALTTTVTFTTDDNLEDVISFYDQELRKSKFNVTKSATQTNGVEYRTIVGYVSSRGAMQSVAVSAYLGQNDETTATLAYTQKGR